MALKGNLHDFSITQLFNLVSLAGKTGTLTLENNTKAARIYFKAGKLILAEVVRPNQDDSLTALMLRAGKISAEQASTIDQRARTHTDKELGLLLISSGYCNQRDIIQVVKNHILRQCVSSFYLEQRSFLLRFQRNAS